MSEIAIGRSDQRGAFTRRAALLIAAIGIFAFILMLVLGAYAPDMKSGKNGGAHALSNAGTGYSGLVRLAEATDRFPLIVRDHRSDSDGGLLVVTPEDPNFNLDDILDNRRKSPTLIVLPKWSTARDPLKPGWVLVGGLLDDSVPERVLAPANKLQISYRKLTGQEMLTGSLGIAVPAPKVLQSMRSTTIAPMLSDRQGAMVLGKVKGEEVYVLADPDLLNNHGIARRASADAALRMLDELMPADSDGDLMFDVTANGLGKTRSPLKLAFDPPFLAVTLAIAAALLLAGLQALVRFGAPLRPRRAIAFGKAALVDNSAALIRKAGREAKLGGRYAATVRDRAAARLRLAPSLTQREVIERLDALDSGNPFSALASRADETTSPASLLFAARALHRWQQENFA